MLRFQSSTDHINLNTEVSTIRGVFSLPFLKHVFGDYIIIENKKIIDFIRVFFFHPPLTHIAYCSIAAILENKETNIIKTLSIGTYFEGINNQNVSNAIEIINNTIITKKEELITRLSEKEKNQYKLALLHSEESGEIFLGKLSQ